MTPGLQNAVILGTKTAMELMSVNRGGKGGVVINVSSMAGELRAVVSRMTKHAGHVGIFPTPVARVYSASKSGVVAYTLAMKAKELTFHQNTLIVIVGYCQGQWSTCQLHLSVVLRHFNG